MLGLLPGCRGCASGGAALTLITGVPQLTSQGQQAQHASNTDVESGQHSLRASLWEPWAAELCGHHELIQPVPGHALHTGLRLWPQRAKTSALWYEIITGLLEQSVAMPTAWWGELGGGPAQFEFSAGGLPRALPGVTETGAASQSPGPAPQGKTHPSCTHPAWLARMSSPHHYGFTFSNFMWGFQILTEASWYYEKCYHWCTSASYLQC